MRFYSREHQLLYARITYLSRRLIQSIVHRLFETRGRWKDVDRQKTPRIWRPRENSRAPDQPNKRGL